jgi:hypothetical protein
MKALKIENRKLALRSPYNPFSAMAIRHEDRTLCKTYGPTAPSAHALSEFENANLAFSSNYQITNFQFPILNSAPDDAACAW